MRRVLSFVISVCVCCSLSSIVRANEYTDVIDAVDTKIGDMFDINLSIGYRLNHKSGVISRENTSGEAEAQSDHYYPYTSMFRYEQVQHVLDVGLDVGLFRDLSLRFGLPLILSDRRSLTAHDDWTSGPSAYSWASYPGGGSSELFGAFGPTPSDQNTFKSAKRSGVDYFAVGLWFNPLDQSRQPTFPNWTLFLEGRFGIGPMLRATCASGQLVPDGSGGRVDCGHPSIDAVDRGGISRGVHEVHFGTRLSRRVGLLDPYFGIDALVGIPKSGSDFVDPDNRAGQINTLPPIRGTMDVGTEIVPWEEPERYRRLVIGIGAGATFHSEGREYSPLYDALGTSGYFLSQDEVEMGGDIVDVSTYTWTGMTDVENYATIFGSLFLLVEPAKYIKFRVGGRFAHETQHFITKTDMCSINLMGVVTGGTVAGCDPYNLGYRPELDTPGGRFRAEKTFFGSFFVDLTAMF